MSGEKIPLVKSKLSVIGEALYVSRLLRLDTESYHLIVWEENLLRIDKAIDTDNFGGEPLPTAKGLEKIVNRIFTVAIKYYKTTSSGANCLG